MTAIESKKVRSASGSAGFTLLEVLVSLSILGLIGVAAAGGIQFGTAVWERSSELGAAEVEGRLVDKALRRLIRAARPIPLASSARVPQVFFEGKDESLTLIAPLPAQIAPRGDHVVTLELKTMNDQQTMVLRSTPYSEAVSDPFAISREDPLVIGVESLRFQYFGPPQGGGPWVWQDDWIGRTGLPELVQIRILRDGHTPHLRDGPPITVRLMLAASL